MSTPEANTSNETVVFTIGAQVSCDEGVCGTLQRVVVDPIAQTVTHLVVAASHRPGRLVPIELVSAASDVIQLRCTQAKFEALEDAEETHFLIGMTEQGGYKQDDMLLLPHFGLGMSAMGSGIGIDAGTSALTYDRVPLGEVEVRRGDRVHATDGPIGRVQGLVIDPRDHQVTHVLLEEGHLWGQKEVAIPISAVTGLDDGVRLSLTKDEVRDLDPVDIVHPV